MNLSFCEADSTGIVSILKHVLPDIAEMVYRVSFQNFYREHFVITPGTKPHPSPAAPDERGMHK